MNNESKKPLVSIITATYKNFDNLFKTIESVVSQDYENIEYIITDDGSGNFPKENVVKYISSFDAKNLKNFHIIEQTKNVGTVRNLNIAYKQSRGEYVFNLSCNDYFYDKQVVSNIVERMMQTGSDLLVTSRIAYFKGNPTCLMPHFEERKVIEKLDTPYKQYRSFLISQFYDMASGSAMYFSRRILEEFGYFDERYRLWEDGPFLAKYLWNHKLTFAYDLLSIWYEDAGVSSRRNNGVNPILKKDLDYYYAHERFDHFDQMDRFVQRYIKYSEEKIHAKGKIHNYFIYVKYFPQAFSYFIYKVKRRKYERNDKKYIGELI